MIDMMDWRMTFDGYSIVVPLRESCIRTWKVEVQCEDGSWVLVDRRENRKEYEAEESYYWGCTTPCQEPVKSVKFTFTAMVKGKETQIRNIELFGNLLRPATLFT